jgi:putative DNA primase/helicase
VSNFPHRLKVVDPFWINLDATIDPETIRAWWTRWPSATVAIRTGAESGIVAIDADLHEAGAAEALAEMHLPPTRIHRTPRGGHHYLYQHPGGRVPCSVGKLGTGIDVRGDGGYILVPPSRFNGSVYSRVVEAGEDLQPLPEHLIPRLVEREQRPKPNGPGDGAKWPEGERNDRMFRLAASLRRKGLSEAAILAALRVENAEGCDPPLDDHELARIAGSACQV